MSVLEPARLYPLGVGLVVEVSVAQQFGRNEVTRGLGTTGLLDEAEIDRTCDPGSQIRCVWQFQLLRQIGG